jgi:protein TonB
MKKVLCMLALAVAAVNVSAADKSEAADLKACAKEYPRAALMNEETGTVQVQVQTGADGKVTDAKVTKSSGSRTLDAGTLQQVKSCKLASRSAGQFTVEYVWTLN